MNSWHLAPCQINGEKMETVTYFLFLGSKITADGDCSHEIKIPLLLWRKAMTNLDSIKKSIDLTLPKKVHLFKAMVFLVVMYGLESWTIKKAVRWGVDAFELWCWGRLLRVPWTERRSYQSMLKEISSKYSLEGLMLKLKVQYFGHLMWRTDSLEKTLMLGKTEGTGGVGDDREWDGWKVSLTQWTWVWTFSRSWWWTGKCGLLQSIGWQSQTWVSDWTKLSCELGISCYHHKRVSESGSNNSLYTSIFLLMTFFLFCNGTFIYQNPSLEVILLLTCFLVLPLI